MSWFDGAQDGTQYPMSVRLTIPFHPTNCPIINIIIIVIIVLHLVNQNY
jgi:hypothetical protein